MIRRILSVTMLTLLGVIVVVLIHAQEPSGALTAAQANQSSGDATYPVLRFHASVAMLRLSDDVFLLGWNAPPELVEAQRLATMGRRPLELPEVVWLRDLEGIAWGDSADRCAAGWVNNCLLTDAQLLEGGAVATLPRVASAMGENDGFGWNRQYSDTLNCSQRGDKHAAWVWTEIEEVRRLVGFSTDPRRTFEALAASLKAVIVEDRPISNGETVVLGLRANVDSGGQRGAILWQIKSVSPGAPIRWVFVLKGLFDSGNYRVSMVAWPTNERRAIPRSPHEVREIYSDLEGVADWQVVDWSLAEATRESSLDP